MFLAFDYEENKYGFLSDNLDYSEYSPDEMYDFLSCTIAMSKKHKLLWCFGLDYFAPDLLYILWHMGYNDMTGTGVPIKKWHVRDYDYTISDDGKAFRIRIRTYDKSTLYIYNACNVIGKDIDSICHDFGHGERSTKTLTEALVKPLMDLGCLRMKNTPFTISMVAKNEWRKLDEIPYNCDKLIDCRTEIAPGGNYSNLDEYIRASYKGGFNYMSELATGILDDGIVLDVNSLYPFMMRTKYMPWGDGTKFEGYIPSFLSKERYYYYVRIRCKFNIKEGYIPFITIRGDMRYKYGEVLSTSDYIDKNGNRSSKYMNKDGEIVDIKPEMVLSKTDFMLFQEAYDIEDLEILDGVYFGCIRCLFSTTIDTHYGGKLAAEKAGNKASRRIHKLIMNALQGNFAKENSHTSLIYSFNDNGSVDIESVNVVTEGKSYIHIASAILSYAREYIYRFAMKYKDRFLYSDTDSLHLLGSDIPDDIPVGENIGQFKVEKRFSKAIYFKRKCYILIDNEGNAKSTIAGLTKECKDYIDVLLTTINKYRNNYGKYLSLDMAVKVELRKANICSEVRGDKGSLVYNDRWDIEQWVYNGYHVHIRNFEMDLEKSKDVDDMLRILMNYSLPNAIRVTECFRSKLMNEWFKLY